MYVEVNDHDLESPPDLAGLPDHELCGHGEVVDEAVPGAVVRARVVGPASGRGGEAALHRDQGAENGSS